MIFERLCEIDISKLLMENALCCYPWGLELYSFDTHGKTHMWKYPVISIDIQDNNELNSIIDDMRIHGGLRPMFSGKDGEYDDNGWYEYSVEISIENGKMWLVGDRICVTVVEAEEEDNNTYKILLTPTQQAELIDRLDKQYQMHNGITIKQELEREIV